MRAVRDRCAESAKPAAWAAAESPDLHIPRLLAGASILPPPAPPGTEPPAPPAPELQPPSPPLPTVAAAPIGVAGTLPLAEATTPSPQPVASVIHTQPMPVTSNEE